MIWSLGPAVYLLYLREKADAEDQPDRIWRILIAKSRRQPTSSRPE